MGKLAECGRKVDDLPFNDLPFDDLPFEGLPFDGADAAVAGVNEIEIELQPIGRRQIGSQPALIAPAIGGRCVLALGLTLKWDGDRK